MTSEILKFGIDLGTTNTCVALYKSDEIKIMDNDIGQNITPTCIAYNAHTETLKHGVNALKSTPDYTIITMVKRFIGKKYSDINPKLLKFYPFVKRGKDDDDIVFEVEYNKRIQYFTPIEVITLFLEKVKQMSLARAIRPDISVETHAVICIPAVFQYSQREGTKQAAKNAGIIVDELLPEATAAALAYCNSNEINKDKCNILVYDFGGGTFDVSIIHLENKILDIIGSEGDGELGGEDITNRIIEYVINEIRKENKDFMKGYEDDCKVENEKKEESKEEKDRIKLNNKYLKRIRSRSEAAKISLSTVKEFTIDDIDDDVDDFIISTAIFEKLCEDIFQKTLNTVKSILSHCNFKPENIDYVVLAGGSSRIPKIKEMLNEYFGGKKVCGSINPDEAIANGAAVYASKDKMKFKFKIKEWDRKLPLPLGIDLGTIFSCTTYYNYSIKDIRVIGPGNGGKSSIPSLIAFEKKGDKIIYGNAADSALITKYSLVSDSKRYIGKDYKELNEEQLQSKSYNIVNDNGIKYKIIYNNKTVYYSPKEISSMVLKHIKTESIPQIPETGKNDPTVKYPIVLTVPADFSFLHREETVDAAEKAGFIVTALINEPTAAALAYVEKNNDNIHDNNPYNLLIYDFGGGTFDISIVRIENIPKSHCKKIKVIWTDGINNLGGQDLTMELIKHIKERARQHIGNMVDLESEKAKKRIEKSAEKTKITLTESENTTVSLEIDSNDYEEVISRSEFNNMIKPYINQTINKVKESLEKSHLNIKDINSFVLTGGSSHIPLVKELLTETFNIPIRQDINPDEAVAIGACLYARNIADEKIEHHKIIDVLSHSLGFEIRRILNGNSIQKILHRMSELPCESSTQIFADKGVAVINIYEGESELPSKNYFLGKLEIRVPLDQNKVEVTFKADINGKLEVYAKVNGIVQKIKNNIIKLR